MRWILAIIISFTTLFLGFTIKAQELALPHGDFETMRKTGIAKVIDVVDPLTIKLDDGRFIRLAGLDYPDLGYYEPGDLAVTAQQILDDFLKGRKVIIYQTKSSKQGRVNRMGHHIAHIARAHDKIWAQGLLLSLGVSRVRTTKHNPEMATQMLNLENVARREKSGLWSMKEFYVLSPEQSKGQIGSYQIIEGTVNNVSMHRNKIYLNFGTDWKDDFTIGISAFDLRSFKKQGIEPRRWKGKRIRMRGWIESYNGPYIEINHPQRIEALFDPPETVETIDRTGLPNKRTTTSKKHQTRKNNSGNALPKLND